MKKLALLVLSSLLGISVSAQQSSTTAKGQSSLASLTLHLPVGVFARTQYAGTGVGYTWSHKRFGRNVLLKKPGLFLDAGATHFLGKKIKVVGRDFRYGGYTYLHTMAGIIVNPWAHAHLSLAAGPTLGIYKRNSDVGYGVSLSSAYFFKQNLSIGPLVTYRKHPKTDALWSCGVHAGYRL